MPKILSDAALAQYERDGYYFQSPISWFRFRQKEKGKEKQNGWDLSPGYEGGDHVQFYRPIMPECFFCHADRVQPIKGTLNRFDLTKRSFDALAFATDIGTPHVTQF